MTFLEAIKHRKPMRRTEYLSVRWVYLGHETEPRESDLACLIGGYDRPQWLYIATGKKAGLSFDDYMADDWEVLE